MNSTEIETSPAGRISKWSLSMAWWGLASAMFWLYIATASASAFGVPETIVGMILSAITYSVINVIMARYAARTGQTVSIVSRRLFGSMGASLATLLFAATALYYAIFEGSVIAVTFQTYFGGSLNLWYFVVVAYAIPLAAGGVERWLDRLNGWLLPVYVIGLVAAVAATAFKRPTDSNWLTKTIEHTPGSLPGWVGAYLVYLGVLVLTMYTFDYARLARIKDLGFHSNVTFGWVFYSFTFIVNGMVGLYLATAWAQQTRKLASWKPSSARWGSSASSSSSSRKHESTPRTII